MHQGFFQLCPFQGLGKIAYRIPFVAVKCHFSIAGDEDDGCMVALSVQFVSQLHAVHFIHHNIQNQEVILASAADMVKEGFSVRIAVNAVGDLCAQQNLLRHICDLNTILFDVIHNGNLRSCICRHDVTPLFQYKLIFLNFNYISFCRKSLSWNCGKVHFHIFINL